MSDNLITRIEEFSKTLRYVPYSMVEGTDKIVMCNCCGAEVPVSDAAFETKTVPARNGNPTTVHNCNSCMYIKGMNLPLAEKISNFRKNILGGKIYPKGNPGFNELLIPLDEYTFILEGEDIKMSYTDILEEISKAYDDTTSQAAEAIEVKLETEEPSAATSTLGDNPDFEGDEEESMLSVIVETPIVPVLETAEATDFEVVEEEEESKVEVIDDNPTVESEVVVEDVNETPAALDFTNLNTSNMVSEEAVAPTPVEAPVVNDTVVEVADVPKDNGSVGAMPEESFFTNLNSQGKSVDINANNSATTGGSVGGGGTVIESFEDDTVINRLITDNKKLAEEDIFAFREDVNVNVGRQINRNRIRDLNDDYNCSRFKENVVDKIVEIFNDRANFQLKTELYLGGRTYECPVVDFEGGIRLVFVDLDIMSLKFKITEHLNKNIEPTFPSSTDKPLKTYTIFNDMVSGKGANRVVKTVAKAISYRVKETAISNLVSIQKMAFKYFYTTEQHDLASLDRFIRSNCPSAVDTSSNHIIGIVVEWLDDSITPIQAHNRSMRNQTSLQRGGDLDYEDISLHLVGTLQYIQTPPKANGVVEITITKYVEAIDLMVKDGFHYAVGHLLNHVKRVTGGAPIDIFYESNPNDITSPTMTQLFRTEALKEFVSAQGVVGTNKLIDVMNKQVGSTLSHQDISGEILNARGYREDHWKTYTIRPEARKNESDRERWEWRKFTGKSLQKTLGSRFKEVPGVNVRDPKSIRALLDKLAYTSVIQDRVILFQLQPEYGIKFAQIVAPYFQLFSIAQYIEQNRPKFVDDSKYAANANGQSVYMPGADPMAHGQVGQMPSVGLPGMPGNDYRGILGDLIK